MNNLGDLPICAVCEVTDAVSCDEFEVCSECERELDDLMTSRAEPTDKTNKYNRDSKFLTKDIRSTDITKEYNKWREFMDQEGVYLEWKELEIYDELYTEIDNKFDLYNYFGIPSDASSQTADAAFNAANS